jgi:type I restriction enzyme R subunit
MPLNIINLFKEIQKKKQVENPDYVPLNIACVFSPPSQLIAKDGTNKVKKMQLILSNSRRFTQEKEDNKQNPEEKKKALN